MNNKTGYLLALVAMTVICITFTIPLIVMCFISIIGIPIALFLTWVQYKVIKILWNKYQKYE